MVRKKVFDIAPSRQQDEIAQIQLEQESEIVPELSSGFGDKKSNRKLIFIFSGVIMLAVASVFSYFYIPHKASINIWPHKKTAEETTQVFVSAAAKKDNVVRGEILNIEKIVSQNFEVSGKRFKEIKSQGKIRVYNNYSDAPQVLIANTRFVSNDGKLFRTPKRVVISGGRYEGGKSAEGFTDIEVIADQPGPEYNIGPSTFSIPGFVGTPKYTAFYAKSFESMTGGAKEQVPYLTQEDFDEAKKALTNAALTESESAVRNAASLGQYALLDQAFSINTSDFKALAQVGQELSNFSAQIKVRAKAIVFKDKQLLDFARSYISGKLLPGEKLIEQFLKTEYALKKVNPEKDEIILELKISGQSHSVPEESALKEMIRGRGTDEIRGIFKELPQIEKVEVELWPFWVNLAPHDQDNINISLKLD